MILTRLALAVAAYMAFAAAPAAADTAYVKSTVNLRAAIGTGSEIVAKIPAGTRIDAGKCSEGWCEVIWQDKKGYAIVTALDLSGSAPAAAAKPRVATSKPKAKPRTRVVRRSYDDGYYDDEFDDDGGMPPPPQAFPGPYYYGPPVVSDPYYGPGPYYGYRPPYWGPRWGYRRYW